MSSPCSPYAADQTLHRGPAQHKKEHQNQAACIQGPLNSTVSLRATLVFLCPTGAYPIAPSSGFFLLVRERRGFFFHRRVVECRVGSSTILIFYSQVIKQQTAGGIRTKKSIATTQGAGQLASRVASC